MEVDEIFGTPCKREYRVKCQSGPPIGRTRRGELGLSAPCRNEL